MMATMQIEPDAEQHAALAAYCVRYAEAGTWLAREIFGSRITDQVRLHRLYYEELRSRFDLPSQSSVLCLKHVTKLCRRAVAVPVLSPTGPVPYDRHLFSMKSVDAVSLITLSGRVVVPCTFAAYQPGGFIVGNAQLNLEDGFWIFSVGTELSDASVRQAQLRREPIMSDKLLNRITRLVSGLAHDALDQAEQAVSVPVLEQAIRDIDKAIKDVRAEIGQAEATKHNVNRRIATLREEHGGLVERIDAALKEGKEELAEAGVGRQLDIESQLPLLQRTLDDAESDIAKLGDSVNALKASRRETEQRVRDLKSASPVPSGGAAPASGSAAERAEATMENAARLGESLTGVPADDSRISHQDLEALEELHRRNAISERLAQHKARMREAS